MLLTQPVAKEKVLLVQLLIEKIAMQLNSLKFR